MVAESLKPFERFSKSVGFNTKKTLGSYDRLPVPPPVPKQEVFSFHEEDSPDNIIFTEEEGIKAGTIEKLVQRLTHEDYLDPPYTQTFLLTYRTFTTPNQLLNILRARYQMKPPKNAGQDWAEKVQKPIRLRIFNTLKNWLLNGFYDFTDNGKLRKNFLHFIEEDMATDLASAAKTLRSVFDRQMSEARKNRDIVFNEKPPKPIIPKSLPEKPTILDISPIELARQLTVIESKLYRDIKPWECLNQSWAKKEKDKRAPRVIAMINRFNQVSNWVATIVVQADPLKNRIAVMKHVIEVANQCLLLNNFNAVMEIISGLQASSVYRLKLTREGLDSKHTKMLEECQRIMERTQNFKNFRQHLHSVDPPSIPYLGMYLTDLTFIEDGNSDYIATANGGSSQLINFVKRKQVSNVIGEIQQYQHAPYCLEPVDFIIDWLLQVETLSEDECYKLSLVREPKGSKMGLDKSSSGTLRKRTSTLSRQASSPFKKGSLASSLGGSQSPSSSDKNAPASSGSLFSSPYGDLEEIKGYKFYEKDSSKNIIIEDYEDRVVIKAGNIYKLVERLTFEKYPDPNYLGAFLASYKTFTTANELLDLLIMRFNMPQPKNPTKDQAKQFKNEKLIPIHFRVFNVLKTWTEKYIIDFKQDTVLVQRVLDFVKKVMAANSVLESAANTILTTLSKKQEPDSAHNLVRLASKSMDNAAAGNEIVPATPRARNSQFLNFSINELCNAIYYTTCCTVKNMDLRECLQNSWLLSTGRTRSPNLYILHQNSMNLKRWLRTELFQAPDVRSRSLLLANFILMADIFSKLRDFHNCFIIIYTLEELKSNELALSWEWLEPRFVSIWSRMKQLKPEGNDSLSSSSTRERSSTKLIKPQIPYLYTTLDEIEKVNQIPDTINDLINFEKRQSLYFHYLPISRHQLALMIPNQFEISSNVENYLTELELLTDDQLIRAAKTMNNERPEGLPPSAQSKTESKEINDIGIDDQLKPLLLQLISDDQSFKSYIIELLSTQIQASAIEQMKQNMQKFSQIAKILLKLVLIRQSDDTKSKSLVSSTVLEVARLQFPKDNISIWTKTDKTGSVYGWEEEVSLVVMKTADKISIIDARFMAKKTDIALLRRFSQFYVEEEEEENPVTCTLIVMTIDDDALEIASSHSINVIKI